MGKEWSSQQEVQAFRPNLIELLRKYSWRRSNPKYNEMLTKLGETADRGEEAFKLIQRGFFSRGQALHKRVALEESRIKDAKLENEIAMLEELDALGIEREYKNNDLQDPTPKMLFHFRLSSTTGPARETLDLTSEEF